MKFFLNARYRSEIITRLRYSKDIIQTSSASRLNRYPKLFEIAARELKNAPNPKILSFGCSTGEEVFSIKKYLPNADIIGIDINRRAISKAKKDGPSGANHFFHSKDERWKAEAPFDCVFALAVFQKSEHREPRQKTALKSFTFNRFEEMVMQLDSILVPGGILVIEHSDFLFLDLPISKNYTVSEMDEAIKRERPIFSKENIKVASTQETNRVFIKDSF